MSGDALTVYASAPLHGPAAPLGRDVIDGEKLALAQAGGRVRGVSVGYVALDDTDPATGRWIPAQVSANARRAAQDRTTIAYLGESDPGASAVSVYVLNQAGILQISPVDTFAGLTAPEGEEPGEPDKYYSSDQRTFGRLVPNDDLQARALVGLMRDQDVKRVYFLHDNSVAGKSLADQTRIDAAMAGIGVAGNQPVQLGEDSPAQVAGAVALAHPDAVFLGSSAGPPALALWRALHAAAPGVKLLAPDAMALPAFYARLGAAASATYLLSYRLPARMYPRAASVAFRRAFAATLHRSPGPYAVYGYEAMRLALDSLRRAGPRLRDRSAVIRAFFAVRDRASPLGRYSVLPSGDVSGGRFGVYRVRKGRLAFERILDEAG